ncbi:hypothetical protein CHARACLAT_004234 [Characodon lateralis]|uniref:Uncharacterized protein n=1 Tax=Characodon lateralis TaxID=208331 RepID=A0ABU7DNC1_9TELE|nr:hypothetical protein [Characodon lateralis]
MLKSCLIFPPQFSTTSMFLSHKNKTCCLCLQRETNVKCKNIFCLIAEFKVRIVSSGETSADPHHVGRFILVLKHLPNKLLCNLSQLFILQRPPPFLTFHPPRPLMGSLFGA